MGELPLLGESGNIDELTFTENSGGIRDIRSVIKFLGDMIQSGDAEYLGTLLRVNGCVCTGNASLISHQIKSSILHLPYLLMEIKHSPELLGACFWSLYISVLQFGGMREVKLIVLEYLLCARHFAECFTQMTHSLNNPMMSVFYFFSMFLNFI